MLHLVKHQNNHILISGKVFFHIKKILFHRKIPLVYFSPRTSQIIAFTSSFIVGLGDSSMNTQVIKFAQAQ